MSKKTLTIRNPYGCHPLLKKGGPHIKSRSNQRRQMKDNLLDEASEYMLERSESIQPIDPIETKETQSDTENGQHDVKGGDKPPFLCLLTFFHPQLPSLFIRPMPSRLIQPSQIFNFGLSKIFL